MASENNQNENNKEGEEEVLVEEPQVQDPLLTVAEWQFALGLPDNVLDSKAKEEVKQKLITHITQNNMAPFYQHLAESFKWPVDKALLSTMSEANKKELAELDNKIDDAEKNLGDTEVTAGKLARANFYARIGEKKSALAAYEETLAKTVGAGARIDLVFSIIRVGLCWNEMPLVRSNIDKAKGLVEKEGDWERRNLLGVYEATYLLLTREFKEAATLLLNSVATFTCYQLFDYNRFVFYAVLSSLVSLDRVTLRDKVVKSPEILSVIREIPHLRSFLMSLYNCQYSEFFRALAELTDVIKRDRYLSSHTGYLTREIRIVAYAQFLQSYRSVTLASMAEAFGVSTTFLDGELSRFIAAGRLNCKIDKVGGIVETNRPDAKNMQYQACIKNGDLLLNRIQKLTKIISH